MHKLIFTFFIFTFSIHFLYGQEKRIVNEQSNTIEIKLDSILENNENHYRYSIIVIDSLKSEIKSSSEQIINKIEKQETQLDEIEQQIQNPSRNVFWDFFYPILLSIIAAIPFWFIFSYYPEYKRKREIREKLDLEVYQIYNNLFFLFDIILKNNNYSPSDLQSKIRGEKLNRKDIENGLQNKCLNETFLYYPEIKPLLLSIGKSLYKNFQKVDRIIDKLFNFSMYLQPGEILLFENLRNKLNTYELEDWETNAISVRGEMRVKSVNPSLSYMTNNFDEIYELYKQLQKLVFKNRFENRNIFISKIQYLFYNGQYEETIKIIKKESHKYPKDENFLNWHIFESLYKLDKKQEACKLLESLFELKANLISSRSFLKDYLEDEEIKILLNKYYSEEDINELEKVIKKETKREKVFIENAKYLKEFYAKKSLEN